MPIKRKFYPDQNYVHSVFTPPLKIEETWPSFDGIIDHPDYRPSMHFLSDRRLMGLGDFADFTKEELEHILDQHVEMAAGKFIRLAMLLSPEFGSNHFFARLVGAIAWQYRDLLECKIFNDEAEALAWITSPI